MERLKEYVHVASSNLLSTPLRSLLSILGIVLGSASVIAVLALGAGAKRELLDQTADEGNEIFRISTVYRPGNTRPVWLELADLENVKAAGFVTHVIPTLDQSTSARSRFGSHEARILAAAQGYLNVSSLELIQGRDFGPVDHEERRLVCLVDAQTASRLLPSSADVVGADLFFFEAKWQVIGLYKERSSWKRPPMDLEPTKILIPLSSFLRHARSASMNEMAVYVAPERSATAAESLKEIISRGDSVRKESFSVESEKNRLEDWLKGRRLLFLLWTIIAGMSLIVGGIGMMNVMLTSVAERTREIGLRRALGARRKDVLVQFLIESCILGLLGGVLGLFTGAALSRALPHLLAEFGLKRAVIEPGFALGAVAVCVLLGIVFGVYPAVRAAAMSPAEALRNDG